MRRIYQTGIKIQKTPPLPLYLWEPRICPHNTCQGQMSSSIWFPLCLSARHELWYIKHPWPIVPRILKKKKKAWHRKVLWSLNSAASIDDQFELWCVTIWLVITIARQGVAGFHQQLDNDLMYFLRLMAMDLQRDLIFRRVSVIENGDIVVHVVNHRVKERANWWTLIANRNFH